MVILKNIKVDNDIIEFDYYPEGENEQGYIKYNYKTDETIENSPTSYDGSLDYVGHAKTVVERFIKSNKKIPNEICELWY